MGLLDDFKEFYTPAANALKAPYGLREDGTPKGRGWLGELMNKNGDVMTEYSSEIDGTLFPTITPNQSFKDMNGLLMQDKLTREMIMKAYQFAMQRKNLGLSPFKD